MAEIPEAGTITAEQAILLLLLENSGDLRRLEKDGAVSAIAPGRYWLKDLVQGFVRYTRKNADMTDTSSLSICFGLTGARIGQLAREGWFKQIERLCRLHPVFARRRPPIIAVIERQPHQGCQGA
jgi:hypothetical protein